MMLLLVSPLFGTISVEIRWGNVGKFPLFDFWSRPFIILFDGLAVCPA